MVIVLICVASNKLVAQRVVPVGALPTYYNGGFAGEAGVTRVASFSYSNFKIDNAFNSAYIASPVFGSFLSVDHFLKRISTGIAFTGGVESLDSRSGSKYASLAISPKISVKGKYTVAPFVDAVYERATVRLSALYDPSQYSSFEINDLKIRGGFLVNSSRAYVGLAAAFARYYKTDYYALEGRWTTFSNMTFSFQTGYTFQQTPESRFSFTPQLALSFYREIYPYDSTGQKIIKNNVIVLRDLNLMFRYDKWIAGVSSAGLVLGYQTSRFKVQISNFYSRRGSNGRSIELSDRTRFDTRYSWGYPGQYTGNISLRYVFLKKEQPKMPGF